MPHSKIEDVAGICVGAFFMALGFCFLKSAGLLTSGISGAALLLHYATGWDYGWTFFSINLPFYWIALTQLGRTFTAKTFAAVALISVFMTNAELFFHLESVSPAFAGTGGGALVGMGLLALFRHGASVGGTSTLAIYLHRKKGWSAGHVLMVIDGLIFVSAFSVLDPVKVMWSFPGAVSLNLMVMLNHKPGRYVTG